MSLTIGDKIGLTEPSVGGDTDTWGTVLNTYFTLADEFHYTEREQRNLVILGGGKIGWDSATGNLTFTSQIELYNHITAFKNIITTAASPTTLSLALKVAYIQLGRKPAADNSITAMTVVAGGALPNASADADMGTFVMAFRTNDSTIILPWARRELLSGDFWQFGTALSWYERLASKGKPSFISNNADTSQVLVPATTTSPAVVNIDGKLYANTAQATMDLDTAGRNGLDTGAKAADTVYYLYAIPPASGRTFDVVCSVTAPTTGPTGFSSWSYLGGFVTTTSSQVVVFTSSDGLCYSTGALSVTVNNAAPAVAKVMQVPTTAKAMALRVIWTAVAAVGDNVLLGAQVNNVFILSRATSTTVGLNIPLNVWVSILTAQTVFANVSTVTTDSAALSVWAWQENPMEFK